MTFRLSLVAAGLSIVQAASVAVAQPLPPPETRDAVACARSADRSICYLQLYSRWLITPLRNDPEFIARPALLKQVEGPNAENVRARQNPSAYTRTALDPSDRMDAALLQALELDAKGAKPDQAIAPILAAVGSLPSRSFALGQITTESGEELRLDAYADLLLRYRGLGPDDKRDKPSKAFVLRVLVAWEKDVSDEFQGSQYFSLEDSRRDLAEAYAELGDRPGAERALKLAGGNAADLAYQLAKMTGDHAEALRLTRADLARNPSNAARIASGRLMGMLIEARKHPDPRHSEEVGRLVLELERKGVLPPQVLGELAPGFPETLRPELVAMLELVLSRPDTDAGVFRGWRHKAAESLLAEFDMARGDAARLDQMIEVVAEKVGGCSTASHDLCPAAGELLVLLIKRGRVLDAKSMLSGAGARRYLDVAPFRPFDLEMRAGQGAPLTMEWMIETETERGAFAMALTALGRCALERAKPVSVVFREAEPDFDAALACARRAVTLSRSPEAITATEEWNAKHATYAQPQGRAAVATMIMELAAIALDARPEISAELELVAFDLWREAPSFKLSSEALFAMRKLAIARLRTNGRF